MTGRAVRYGLWCGVVLWLADSMISIASEVHVERALEAYLVEADRRGEVRCQAQDIMEGCDRLELIEPYAWREAVGLPLYSMVAGLNGMRLAWLLNGDTYGALILYDGEGRVMNVAPIPASLLGAAEGPAAVRVASGGRAVILGRRQ